MAKHPARSRSGETFAALIKDYAREAPDGRWLHSYDKARLLRAFGRRRLSDLTEKHFTDYGIAREAAGATAEIINEELRTLGAILFWGRKTRRLTTYPKIQTMRVERKQTDRRSSSLESAPPEHPAKPTRLSDAVLREHIAKYPIDKQNRDGSRFSDRQRARAIKRWQGITVDRTTVSRRLRPFRQT